MRQTRDPQEPANQSQHTQAPEPIAAASVIVLRPHAQDGFEVLLMERAATSRNFAGTLVFPGGKVDAGDEAIANAAGFANVWAAHQHAFTRHQLDAPTAASLYGAALRETLEEVGLVWTADGQAPQTAQWQPLRHALLNGTPWAQATQAQPLACSVQNLLPFSRWITPKVPNFSSKRFDTWFLLAQAPAEQTAQADTSEAVRLVWGTPRALLASHQRREILLPPPQIMTLAHLSRFASIAAVQTHASTQAPYCITPVSVDVDGQRMVCFPGDPLHEETTTVMPGPQRLVMRNRWFEPKHAFDDLFV
ncbi:NUDIX hydrolase [Lampropedia puyangensis]|uniref:NUDIX hydrolase n=1 Tax=Lampropedia puyangensis TaxID=1330072 RepID=A0A4S8EUV6_9BURK|nr:NUDIX domain-containing protein [Lampropedia puyangensis]THT98669.1 NUDIX hydrolase [Lampropedia puyangensis]